MELIMNWWWYFKKSNECEYICINGYLVLQQQFDSKVFSSLEGSAIVLTILRIDLSSLTMDSKHTLKYIYYPISPNSCILVLKYTHYLSYAQFLIALIVIQ